MTLQAGTRIGPYQIDSPLGRGGMGEVYRARDTKLNRDVAIKVLPELFADDRDRLARFTREAQTLAALNHLNIAQVYGLEDLPADAGTRGCALVMELVEGQTLEEVIDSRSGSGAGVPLQDALPIARQIAEGLEAAHERGVIHRDLKPANVKVMPDGGVKILDFGLAKAADPGSGSGSVSASPTLTARATAMGVILGTAAYMAPEQARGKAVDRRADIWSFGCVLYELVTGRRPFDGDEITDVLARVIERDPDWSKLPPSTPPVLRRLIERCLTKDPKARLRDIGEARCTLDDLIAGRAALASGPVPRAPDTRRRASWIPWALVLTLAAAAGAGWLRPTAGNRATSRPTRVELRLADDVDFYGLPRISPDGRRVLYVANREGVRQAYLRELDQADARPLAGTDGAILLTFAPDSQSAAVVTTDGRLKRVGFASGEVDELTSGVDIVGGLHWSSDGKILFGLVTKIAWVSPTGGKQHEIVSVSTGTAMLTGPVATPDGKMVLFTSFQGPLDAVRPRIEAADIGTGARHVVLDNGGFVLAALEDRLLYQREGGLYSAPFDPVKATVTGAGTRLSDEIRNNPWGSPAADLTAAGDLLFAENRTFTGRLTWVSLDGVERIVPAPPRTYSNPRVSPDGRRVAYSDGNVIWTTDTERGAQSRIYAGIDGLTGFPIWSPDGLHLYVRTSAGIARLRADGEGKPEIVTGTQRTDYPNAVSPDGSVLAVTRISVATGGDIFLVPLQGGETKPLVSTAAYEGGTQFSPDGKWAVYSANTSTRMEVYLRPLDRPGLHQVSTMGGIGPLWTPDGKRILFRNGRQFLAVDVTTTPEVRFSAPKVLFERRYSFGPNITIANYALSKDGREFLVVNSGGGHLSLIFNWLQHAGR